MIVKNEIDAIQRCLDSVLPFIDHWIIVDTGSTDGTQQKILECLRALPGKLYERPWVDFAHNRNEALELARGKADYLFFIDADERVLIGKEFDKRSLQLNYYYVKTRGAATDHHRLLFIDNHPAWRWEGVVHEYLVPPPGAKGAVLLHLVNECSAKDGHRSKDPAKHLKDAELLKKALSIDPANARYAFYLAQSLAHAGNFTEAIDWYEKRAKMGGEPDEIFWSLYCSAHLKDYTNQAAHSIIASYCRAHLASSSRAEPLERLANFFYEKGWPLLGYLAAEPALALPAPQALFSYSHPWVYDYGALFIYTLCSFALGRNISCEKLLLHPRLPEHLKKILLEKKP